MQQKGDDTGGDGNIYRSGAGKTITDSDLFSGSKGVHHERPGN